MTSLSKNARIAGLLYLVASLISLVRMLYIPSALFVRDNAAATAANISSHEFLFRLGIVTSLLGSVLWLFVPLALYRLLKDIDHPLAAVMVILGGLMQVPLAFINSVADGGALLFARGADFLTAFDKPQREAMVMVFLRLHHQLDLANAIFWGLWLLPLGVLIYRSRFLPRFLGVWLVLGCFGWLVFSFTGFLAPEFENQVFKFSQIVTLSEIVTLFWLLIMGARERRVAAAL